MEEAHIIAIACSEAPEGRERWTLQLIADELVRLGVVESVSDTAVMNTLTPIHASWLKLAFFSVCLKPCLLLSAWLVRPSAGFA